MLVLLHFCLQILLHSCLQILLHSTTNKTKPQQLSYSINTFKTKRDVMDHEKFIRSTVTLSCYFSELKDLSFDGLAM